MSKSGAAFEKLTYDEIQSLVLKEMGKRLEKQFKNCNEDMWQFGYEVHEEIEALKCGVMPK